MLDVSETLLLGFDLSDKGDVPTLSVVLCTGTKYVYLNTFQGQEAEDLYAKLSGSRKIERENNHE